MLLLIASWLMIGAVSLPIGLAVLHGTRLPDDTIETRALAATWTGVTLVAATLLIVSLEFSLRPVLVLALMALAVAMSISLRTVRAELIATCRSFKKTLTIISGVIATGVIAYRASGVVTFFDTGYYHYPITDWLSRHGSVRGLGLVLAGFPSSWFALAAPFNVGPLSGRVAVIPNSFIALLATIHVGIIVTRRFSQNGDLYLAIAMSLGLFYLFRYDQITSLSPDAVLMFLVPVIAWLLVFSQRPKDVSSWARSRNSETIAFMLAFLAIAVKVSALPLLIVSGIWMLLHISELRARLLLIACIGPVALLASHYWMSGCLIYPIETLCLHPSWGVPADSASELARVVLSYARWNAVSPPSGSEAWDWLPTWLSGRPLQGSLDVLFLLSAPVVLMFSVTKRKTSPNAAGAIWLVVLALCGWGISFVSAPDIRFSFPYLAIYYAFILAVSINTLTHKIAQRPVRAYLSQARPNVALLLPLILLVFALVTVSSPPQLKSDLARTESTSRFLHPPSLNVNIARSDATTLTPSLRNAPQVLEVGVRRAVDFLYLMPSPEQLCWATPLPCTVNLIPDEVRLRSPAEGLGGGFEQYAPNDE